MLKALVELGIESEGGGPQVIYTTVTTCSMYEYLHNFRKYNSKSHHLKVKSNGTNIFVHTMKACGEYRCSSMYWIQALEVSGHFKSWGNSPRYPVNRLGGPRTSLDICAGIRITIPRPLNPQPDQYNDWAARHSLVTIPTELHVTLRRTWLSRTVQQILHIPDISKMAVMKGVQQILM